MGVYGVGRVTMHMQNMSVAFVTPLNVKLVLNVKSAAKC